VARSILLKVLDQEAGSFQKIDRRWRPNGLLVEPYRRNLLKDVKHKFAQLESATGELEVLDKADKYIKLLLRMRLNARQANFAWRYDDMIFIQAIADFYSDYGAVLRLLVTDKARGLIGT
jgi:hypothetical protein